MYRTRPLPPPDTVEKELYDQAFADWWWLERYQLPPDEVAALPLNTQDRVPIIAAAADEIAEREAKKPR